MHPNAELIDRFYGAFARRDAEAMAACYADDVVFSDDAFGELRGERARNMWRMLLSRSKDLEVTHSGVEADDRSGSARWVARYTFGATGRKVKNVIAARFEFKDGRIVRHDDRFDFWKWSWQALGWSGWFLGWSQGLRRAVRKKALAGLDAFESSRA